MSLSMSTVMTLFQIFPGPERKESSDTLDESLYDLEPEIDENDASCPYIVVGQHQVGVVQMPICTPQASPYNPQVDELEEYQRHLRVWLHRVGSVGSPNSTTGISHHTRTISDERYICDPWEDIDDDDDDDFVDDDCGGGNDGKDRALIQAQGTSQINQENMECMKAMEEEMINSSTLQYSPQQTSIVMRRHECLAVTTLELGCPKALCMYVSLSTAALHTETP